MHSNIGGIHTNGPTLSNTTTHYILQTPILLLYIQSLRALFFSFFFFSLELENLENCFSKLFKSIFPGKHLDQGWSTLKRQAGWFSEGVLSCVPKDLRKSFIFERDCRVELLNISTILRNYEKIVTLRLIQTKL